MFNLDLLYYHSILYEWKTIGKALLRIYVKGKSDRITMKELFIRYGIFYFILGGINYILSSSSILNHTEPLVLLVILLFQIVINGLFIIHVLLHVFSPDKLLFYERISQTRNAIILKKLTSNTLSAFFIIVNNFSV